MKSPWHPASQCFCGLPMHDSPKVCVGCQYAGVKLGLRSEYENICKTHRAALLVSLISGGQCSFPFFTPHKARSQEIHNHLETPLSLSLYNPGVHHLAVGFQLIEVGIKSRGRKFRSPENTRV